MEEWKGEGVKIRSGREGRKGGREGGREEFNKWKSGKERE